MVQYRYFHHSEYRRNSFNTIVACNIIIKLKAQLEQGRSGVVLHFDSPRSLPLFTSLYSFVSYILEIFVY